MKRFALVVALFCAAVMAGGERAAAQVAINETPAVISLGAGWYDFNLSDDEAVDFRLEYRHGEDFLYLKPWAGVEVTTDGSVWGGVGVLVDISFFDAVVLTGSFAPGLYEDGGGKDLGHTIEFRSQVELGYQFENKSRLSLAFSHISNAHIGDDNPGTEVLNLYYHVPLDLLF